MPRRVQHALRTLDALRAGFPEEVIRAVLAENPRNLSGEARTRYPEALENIHEWMKIHQDLGAGQAAES